MTQHDNADGALAAAVSIARHFNSYVEGYYAQPTPQIFIGDAGGMAAAYSSEMTDIWLAAEHNAHGVFSKFMEQNGLPFGSLDKPKKTPTAGWHEPDGNEAVAVGEYGRLFDLIIIGQHSDDGRNVTAICKKALFEGGRPILLAPRKPIEELGQTIVIAWNGSTETARTISLGMSLIEKAQKVCVLTVEGGTVPGPSGEQVALHLRLRGIKAEALMIEPSERTTGEAVLEEASALGADLVFKGAYTHSRLRQMVFGGATRHIMSASVLPVFMAH